MSDQQPQVYEVSLSQLPAGVTTNVRRRAGIVVSREQGYTGPLDKEQLAAVKADPYLVVTKAGAVEEAESAAVADAELEAQHILDEARTEAASIIDTAKTKADTVTKTAAEEAQKVTDAAKAKGEEAIKAAQDQAKKIVDEAKKPASAK